MTSAVRHAVFPTALGDCALAWNGRGIVGVILPGADRAALERTLRRRHPATAAATPDAERAASIEAIRRLLDGEPVDLRHVVLDLGAVTPFNARVYAATREIGPGRVRSYAEVAAQVGGEASAREVGRALGENPFAIVVPCHRVVAADGRLGGFSAPGGSATKQRLLAIERACRDGVGDLFAGEAGTG